MIINQKIKMMLRFLFVSLVLFNFSYNIKGQSLDSENSVVTFSVSNMRLNTVEGTFKGMKGDVNFKPDNIAISSFDVCIEANTIDTGNSKRDQHLKNEDFFEVDKYPSICFQATQIIKTESGYKTIGILSMHGVSETVEIPFTYSDKELVGNFKVNRFDYNIGEGTGKFMVGKEINIKIVAILN